jgi:predicted O-methyltransferase YrrM
MIKLNVFIENYFLKVICNFKFLIILNIICLNIIFCLIIKVITLRKTDFENISYKKNISSQYSNIEEFDKDILIPIRPKLEGYIEITSEEQNFLNGLIRKIRPKKIVEIGVAYGGTAVVILNAIKDINDSKLFSIDISENCYKLPSKKTGFIVKEKFQELSNKWEIHTGGFTSEFIEKIGNEIDLVYIDTVHTTPCEMFNFLEILPFLKEGAFIILHDIFMMYMNNRIYKQIVNFSNNQILCYIRGDIILPSYSDKMNVFSNNIGALKLHKNQKQYLLQYFLALGTQWQYWPTYRQLNVLKKYFKKYYEEKYIKIFEDAIEKNKQRFQK